MSSEEAKDIYEYTIVGAGLSGLGLAYFLNSKGLRPQIQIIEKSKGCGGRMATRRINDSKYDHGAQFIKRTEASDLPIRFWQSENLIRKFPLDAENSFCGVGGMTQLAKKMAENLQIYYNCKVIGLKKVNEAWQLTDDQGKSFYSKKVILSCPLPQALELLTTSNIPFDSGLSEILYAKAIVQLVQFDKPIEPNVAYAEKFDSEIFSLSSQRAKGMALGYEYTIVMNEAWSENQFQKSEEELFHISYEILRSKFPNAKILNLQIKKWRYSHPTKKWINQFASPQDGLYLVGDAFGGPSLNGALASAWSLANDVKFIEKRINR